MVQHVSLIRLHMLPVYGVTNVYVVMLTFVALAGLLTVNIMKQRLQTLLTTEKLASSKFADIIGVNRSSISHLLSGRNKPSLDFLQKVLVRFPQINPDWLLLGQGSMYRNDKEGNAGISKGLFADKEVGTKESLVGPKEETKPIQQAEPETEAKAKEPEERAVYNAKNGQEAGGEGNTPGRKVLDRIVFFYSDSTFDTYYPNKP